MDWYVMLLVFLAVTAALDLFVGVSNDAVNFLNSALGCRIASFRTVLWTASAGVMLGATFSSGMMEVARSGVFHPQMFSFAEIMVIFLAVMVADILLLDTFNSLGLPTSTTVSIVFELLGSAVAAALFKLTSEGADWTAVAEFINSSKALAIVSGILISVAVAFVTGAVVQFLMRLVFSFKVEKAYRRFGAVFAGLAVTAIVYFLVMKGAKGASFMRPEWIRWIADNTGVIVSVLFAGFTVFFEVLILMTRVNIFKIIILLGTFSLAFAFAGNDLVNFVGVPLAAFESWQSWRASGVPADTFLMADLLKPSQAPSLFLLAAGAVMVLTLWFSRKAYRVVQTSINLSAASSGEEEKFGASLPGRLIVRAGLTVGELVRQILPIGVRRGVASRFEPVPLTKGETPLPFDYVRASVNLVVSAALIASATSLKLPLSTTYVTFMVAMGSSFADGAWDRESAVYRISGVLTVISGWFLTALTASTLAGGVATLIFWGGKPAAALLAAAALLLLLYSNWKRRSESDSIRSSLVTKYDAAAVTARIQATSEARLLSTLAVFYELVQGFFADSETRLRRTKAQANELFDELGRDRSLYYRMANAEVKATKADFDARYGYYRVCTNLREAGRSLQSLTKLTLTHVANRHRLFEGELKTNLEALPDVLMGAALRPDGKADPVQLAETAPKILAHIDALQSELLRKIPEDKLSARGSELYLNFLLFARDLVGRCEAAALVEKQLAAKKSL